jgi:chromosome segregation ATPase
VQAPLRYLLRQPDVSIGGLSVARLAAGFTEPQGGLPPDDPALVQLRQQLKDAQDALAAANGRVTDATNQLATARQQITNMQTVSKAQLNAHKAQLTAAGISVPALVAAQLVDPP